MPEVEIGGGRIDAELHTQLAPRLAGRKDLAGETRRAVGKDLGAARQLLRLLENILRDRLRGGIELGLRHLGESRGAGAKAAKNLSMAGRRAPPRQAGGAPRPGCGFTLPRND